MISLQVVFIKFNQFYLIIVFTETDHISWKFSEMQPRKSSTILFGFGPRESINKLFVLSFTLSRTMKHTNDASKDASLAVAHLYVFV
jgi:hypothetical protein